MSKRFAIVVLFLTSVSFVAESRTGRQAPPFVPVELAAE